MAADFCGSKRYGFQALFLDRSNNNKVTVYQDWLSNPDYPGKSEDDIKSYSVNDFEQIRNLLEIHICLCLYVYRILNKIIFVDGPSSTIP